MKMQAAHVTSATQPTPPKSSKQSIFYGNINRQVIIMWNEGNKQCTQIKNFKKILFVCENTALLIW
jgi:hypothetical protein